MYGYPLHYRPVHRPSEKTEPTPQMRQAALLVGASKMSADGRYAYCQRFNYVYQCEYSEEFMAYGSWWAYGEQFPKDTVEVR